MIKSFSNRNVTQQFKLSPRHKRGEACLPTKAAHIQTGLLSRRRGRSHFLGSRRSRQRRQRDCGSWPKLTRPWLRSQAPTLLKTKSKFSMRRYIKEKPLRNKPHNRVSANDNKELTSTPIGRDVTSRKTEHVPNSNQSSNALVVFDTTSKEINWFRGAIK